MYNKSNYVGKDFIMFIDSNQKCPVCDKQFLEEDDVVICPYCGTPHHRECYASLGHCYNADKHKSDFEYKNEPDNTVTENVSKADEDNVQSDASSQNEYYNVNQKQNNKTVCRECSKEIDSSIPFCNYCGARQENAVYQEYSQLNNFGFNNTTEQQYQNDTQTIDGRGVAEVAAVVRTNTHKFIPKFLKNKKLSWNWSAFFFGPYYLFYRKMYKEGSIALAIHLIVQLVVTGAYAEKMTAFMSFFNANFKEFYSNPTVDAIREISPEVMSKMTELSNAVMPMIYIMCGALLVISIVIALFADSFYKAKVIKVLNKVDENLDNGGSFDMTMPMFNGSTFSQEDMKKLYLGKMGGTSILSPIAAWLVLDLITGFISQL